MARTWQIGTLIEAKMTAINVRTLRFKVEPWLEHKAGQHYAIRLTAPNGYQAERDYSIASAPEEKGIVELGVQLLENGEVSPYLFKLEAGGQIEMHGPIGGHFVWNTNMPGPLVLIGGGSGMVPLVSMLRHYVAGSPKDEREIVFLISARTLEHVLYREELFKLAKDYKNIKVVLTITDQAPADWTGYTRRVDQGMMQEVLGNLVGKMPMIYICGPTPFVEVVANYAIGMGFNSHEVKTERFGGA